MIRKFRKKPVVIEAIQLTKDNADEVIQFIIPRVGSGEIGAVDSEGGIRIATLERAMIASIGDFIIKDIMGKFYPCKPDIFEATYEPVDNKE